jgi:hypothetical protein
MNQSWLRKFIRGATSRVIQKYGSYFQQKKIVINLTLKNREEFSKQHEKLITKVEFLNPQCSHAIVRKKYFFYCYRDTECSLERTFGLNGMNLLLLLLYVRKNFSYK